MRDGQKVGSRSPGQNSACRHRQLKAEPAQEVYSITDAPLTEVEGSGRPHGAEVVSETQMKKTVTIRTSC